MSRNTTLKRLVAIIFLCVICVSPLVSLGSIPKPTFNRIYRVPRSVRESYGCWKGPDWVWEGDEVQGETTYYSDKNHRTAWTQEYRCSAYQACCHGSYKLTKYTYGGHERSKVIKTEINKKSKIKAVTYYCNECKSNFVVETKIK